MGGEVEMKRNTRRFLHARGMSLSLSVGMMGGYRTGGAAVMGPFVRALDDYIDNFTGGAVALASRPNWTFGAGTAANWLTAGGSAYQSVHYSLTQEALFAPAFVDFDATYIVNTTGLGGGSGGTDGPFDTTRSNFYFWWQDSSNYGSIATPVSGAGTCGLRIVVAGTPVASAVFQDFNSVTQGTHDKLRIQSRAGNFRASINGEWNRGVNNNFTYPYRPMNFTAVAAGAKTGKMGIEQDTNRYAICDTVAISTLRITIDYCSPFVGRTNLAATSGTGRLRGFYSGSPSSWLYRILSAANQATVIKDWAFLANVVAASNAWSADIPGVPVGGPYIVEAGWTGADGKSYTSTSGWLVCGRRGIVYGQSNAEGRRGGRLTDVGAGLGTSILAMGPLITGDAAPQEEWGMMRDDVATIAITAQDASNKLSTPVGVNVAGSPATPITGLSPGNSSWDSTTSGLVGLVQSTPGIVEFVIWDQGEAEADGNGTNVTTYASDFLSLIWGPMKTLTGNTSLKLLISAVGRYSDGTNGPSGSTFAFNDPRRDTLKKQYEAIAASDPTNIFVSSSKLGCDHGTDAYHYTSTGYYTVNRRDGSSAAYALGAAASHLGTGPVANAATRAGAVITLALTMNGATGLSGPTAYTTGPVVAPLYPNTFKGYQVSADSFATLLPITSIATSGSTLVITLTSAPAGAVSVRSFYGSSYDDTSLFVGNYTDTANIPIMPITTALVSN